RIVDEIDAETAQLFERVCSDILDDVLVISLSGELPFDEIMKLSDAGLIVDPGVGHIRKFTEAKNNNGTEVWFCILGQWAIGYRKNAAPSAAAYFNKGDPPSLDVYIFTDAGVAI